MRVEQAIWTAPSGWEVSKSAAGSDAADLVLYFGAPGTIEDGARVGELRRRHPKAIVAGCSTSGEIHGNNVLDGVISATAFTFDNTKVRAARVAINETPDARSAGATLGAQLRSDDLRSLFLLSDGTKVNATDLIRGLRSGVGDGIAISGGLAGDGANFRATTVGLDGRPEEGLVCAVAFYGPSFRLSHGCSSGWDAFGPERTITRAEGNVLLELDGKPALELYRRYLGPEAANLPASALLFPLRVYESGREENHVVRTIVGIDNERQGMVFAGDMPQKYKARLMRGNLDRLITSAGEAARQALPDAGRERAAIIVSCVGRKLLMGQRTVEEVEAVGDILGENVTVTGFYSYGEISPHAVSGLCELHNQTLTVTVFSES